MINDNEMQIAQRIKIGRDDATTVLTINRQQISPAWPSNIIKIVTRFGWNNYTP
jgi:hypothetical protein